MEITKVLAEFVTKKYFNDIPEKAIEVAKDHSLDCLGVIMLAASSHLSGQIIIKYVKAMGEVSEAGVVAGHFRTSVLNAAFANGTMASALGYDDFGYYGGRPTAILLPAVLSLAEKLSSSGKDILEAIIMGYEVYGEIGTVWWDDLYVKGWSTSAIFGTMGATAAAAKLLKLNIEQTMMAFGIAASLASGLDANSLSMTKALHFGNAARNGIVAATLAGEGFTANPEILDDPLGFSHTFAGGGYHVEKLTKELGNPFKLISDGPLLKKYPGCGGSHRALDAVLQLAEEHNILYEQVDSVEVEESSFNSETLKYSQPDTGYQAECSMEYVVAAAILDKKIVLGTFSDETIRDPKMKKAMKKVKVVVHPEWPPGAKFDTPVTIKLRDGSVYTKQIDTLRVSSSELATKYRDCAQKVLSPAQIKRSMELVLNLEHLNNVKELMQILTFGADEWK